MSASPQLSLNSILENVSHAGGTTSGNSGIPSFSLTMFSKSLTSFFPKLGGYFLGPDASWQTKLVNSNSMYNSIYNAFENNCLLKMLNKEHIMYCQSKLCGLISLTQKKVHSQRTMGQEHTKQCQFGLNYMKANWTYPLWFQQIKSPTHCPWVGHFLSIGAYLDYPYTWLQARGIDLWP